MTVSLLHGNALSLPLADRSVHLVCTSPPYFALRSYRDGDEHFDGQLGSETTPLHFLAALWAVMDECWRVLRDDGSCWVNLGDKFAGSGGHNNAGLDAGVTINRGSKACADCGLVTDRKRCNRCQGPVRWTNPAPRAKSTRRTAPDRYNQNAGGLRAKSRMLLPHRFAEGLIDPDYRLWTEHRAGLTPTAQPPQWICRMDAVWSKRNHLPESTKDRLVAAHEYWFHLAKCGRYFSAVDEIREPTNEVERRLGSAPGSVWTVATEPLTLPPHLPQHFAAFPSYFPRRIVAGWSPSGVCTVCGEGRRPVCEKERTFTQRTYDGSRNAAGVGGITNPGGQDWLPGRDLVSITGYACACPTPTAPTTPARVLDPFSGTGTTAIVADALGRHGVGVDLSWDYHRIARWRHDDGGLRAKAVGVDKPAKELAGQLSLLGEAG